MNLTLAKLAEARESGDLSSIVGLEKTLAFNLSGHVLRTMFWTNFSPDGGDQIAGTSKQRSTRTSEASPGYGPSTRTRIWNGNVRDDSCCADMIRWAASVIMPSTIDADDSMPSMWSRPSPAHSGRTE